MTDHQIELLIKVAGLCAIGAFWPLVKDWLARRGFHYRTMKEQREYEAQQERERLAGVEVGVVATATATREAPVQRENRPAV